MDAAYTDSIGTDRTDLNRLGNVALVVGIIALAIAVVGGLMVGGGIFWRSYLLGYIFWAGVAVGSLGLLLLQYLTGGAWGFVIRRILEAGSRTILPMAVLFIPVLIGVHQIYVWSSHDANIIESDHALEHAVHHKHAYLNVPFFGVRAALYFLIWIGLAYLLNKWSLAQDRTADQSYTNRRKVLSGPGLVIFILAVTFAAFDWIMSLEPEWYSTIFGLLVLIGWTITAFTFVILMIIMLSKYEPLASVLMPAHFHDLGKLLLAFVMVWAYFSFSQFLIIWSGNLPEEIPWYLRRTSGVWGYVALAVVALHFVLPFFLLLSRDFKRRRRSLALVAGLVLVMRLVDLFWIIAPSFHYEGFHNYPSSANLLFFAAAIGMGGLWVFFFVWQLKKRPLIPLNDPQLQQTIDHGRKH
jgi:hypothetical protein